MEGGSKLSAPMLPRGAVQQAAFVAVQTVQGKFFSRFNCLPDTVDLGAARALNTRHDHALLRSLDPESGQAVGQRAGPEAESERAAREGSDGTRPGWARTSDFLINRRGSVWSRPSFFSDTCA
jgi:hypothetical protein